MEKTKCEKCGMFAVLERVTTPFVVFPLEHKQQWKCGCGWTANAYTKYEKTADEAFTDRWEKENAKESIEKESI